LHIGDGGGVALKG